MEVDRREHGLGQQGVPPDVDPRVLRIGVALRATRRRRGLRRSEVARQARIPARYIMALEDGDVGMLPEGSFRDTYRRQYMAFLGMPPLVGDVEIGPAHSESEEEDLAELSRSTATIPRGEDLPIGRLVVAGFAFTLLTLLGLRVASLLLDTPEVVEIGAAPVAVAMNAVVPTPVPKPVGPAPEPEPEVSADEALVPPAPVGSMVVRVRAIEPVRVVARAGGELQHTGFVKPGTVLSVASDDEISLHIADLTRVTVYLNDERIEPLHNLSKGRRLVFVPSADGE